jgi:hypothetical protein
MAPLVPLLVVLGEVIDAPEAPGEIVEMDANVVRRILSEMMDSCALAMPAVTPLNLRISDTEMVYVAQA